MAVLREGIPVRVFVVSSGPTKYGTVVSPDADIVSELQSRGQVFRTDTNDMACAVNPRQKSVQTTMRTPAAATISAS